jgi:hypothetical protein
MGRTRGWLIVAVLLTAAPHGVAAQVRASERGGAFQQVNGTTITIDYARPGARGRADIYGGLIPWGKVWTPGANWATTLEVDHDVAVQGQSLKAGKYAVWMEVQPTAWTVILDGKARAFHTAPPRPDSGQVRFSVSPEDVSGPEFLTWSFPEFTATGTTVRMAWAGKSVSFQLTVPSTPVPAVSAQAAAPYPGSYQVIFGPGSGGRTIPAEAPPEWKVQYWLELCGKYFRPQRRLVIAKSLITLFDLDKKGCVHFSLGSFQSIFVIIKS